MNKRGLFNSHVTAQLWQSVRGGGGREEGERRDTDAPVCGCCGVLVVEDHAGGAGPASPVHRAHELGIMGCGFNYPGTEKWAIAGYFSDDQESM